MYSNTPKTVIIITNNIYNINNRFLYSKNIILDYVYLLKKKDAYKLDRLKNRHPKKIRLVKRKDDSKDLKQHIQFPSKQFEKKNTNHAEPRLHQNKFPEKLISPKKERNTQKTKKDKSTTKRKQKINRESK